MKARTRRTVLLTGFEPFAGESINPAWEAVRGCRGKQVAGHRIVTACLPVQFGAALERLQQALTQHRPALVIAVGQAGGRSALSIERVAINIDDARIADNAGQQPIDQPVVRGAPAAYFSTLPIKAVAAALRAAGIPAEISQSAGTFVCNHVFYGLMHRLHNTAVRGGFVHIPYAPTQAAAHPGQASMAIETVQRGLLLMVRVALTEAERCETGGALH